jgi:anti-sigma factor RsiW
VRPYVVGGACHRVRHHLENALAEGVLELPPELAAHAGRCPHCGPQVRELEALFRRLREASAHMDMGPVPDVVDAVLQKIAAGQPAPENRVRLNSPLEPVDQTANRRAHLRWVLGQVAAIVAALCVAVGGLTYLALKVNQAVGGARPAEVVQRWMAPLQDWTQALFGNMR